MKSIYQNQCAELRQLFAQVSPDRILAVAIDFALDQHVVLFCNGQGEQVLKPFPVHNNTAGFLFLKERILSTCRRLQIDPSHVVLAGEDDPPYALNFLWALNQEWLVLRVNARIAKEHRENLKASTDLLDLLGIAKALLSRQAHRVFPLNLEANDALQSLKTLERDRDAIVKDATRLKNRIHSHVKILFPGFLEAHKDNPVKAFGKPSLALMAKDDFCATTYARKKAAPLARCLKSLRLRLSQEKAVELIKRASEVLAPPPHRIESEQLALGSLLVAYQALEEAAYQLELQQSRILATHSAAMLTTLPGVGIITVSAMAGELGQPEELGSRAQMASYAGIVPQVEQSGGPNSATQTKPTGHRCNHRLKNHLVRAAMNIGTLFGPTEIRQDYRALRDQGRHANFIHARRLLGQFKALTSSGSCWLPPSLREGVVDQGEAAKARYRNELHEYFSYLWPKLVAKWAVFKLEGIFEDPQSPLGQWRDMIQNIYRISLPMDGPPILKDEEESDVSVGTSN